MSALRINLLPAYISEVRNTKVAIGVVVAVFAAAVAVLVVVFVGLQATTTAKEAEANDMESQASSATSALNKVKADASGRRAQVAPIGDRVKFVKDIYFYNTWVQKIYRRAARYTDEKVEYSAMAVNGGTLSMTGYAQKVDDLARYLITFYGNPDVTAVSVSGPPGWERPLQNINPLDPTAPSPTSPASTGFGFSVTATLLKSLKEPQVPASLTGEPGTTEGGGAKSGGAAPSSDAQSPETRD